MFCVTPRTCDLPHMMASSPAAPPRRTAPPQQHGLHLTAVSVPGPRSACDLDRSSPRRAPGQPEQLWRSGPEGSVAGLPWTVRSGRRQPSPDTGKALTPDSPAPRKKRPASAEPAKGVDKLPCQARPAAAEPRRAMGTLVAPAAYQTKAGRPLPSTDYRRENLTSKRSGRPSRARTS